MLNKTTTLPILLTSALVSFVLASTGCRSTPYRNPFAFRTQPSAETLAGNGPTATYPAPPSASATPEAIASVAGGTAAPTQRPVTPSQPKDELAGIDISPGYATPASSPAANPTNLAAAQANGIFHDKANATTENPVTPASGYAFGSKALTPKSTAPATAYSASPAAPAASASVIGGIAPAASSAYPTPNGDLQIPSTSLASNPALGYPAPAIPSATTPAASATTRATTGTPPAASSPAASSPAASGFTMPIDATAIAAIAAANPNGGGKTTQRPTTDAASAFAPPAAVAPDFSTASADQSSSATSITPQPGNSSGGYMPGSTSAGHGYPSGSVAPTTSGSFYR
jgi:hypothetical protein